MITGSADPEDRFPPPRRATLWHDAGFQSACFGLATIYAALIVLMLMADVSYTSFSDLIGCFRSREIRYAAVLSIASSTITAILCVWVATPTAYLLSRGATDLYGVEPRGAPRWIRTVADVIFDLPIVLPPLVVGVSLLILFKCWPLTLVSDWVVYEVPAVILAQFVVACAFAVRTLRATFDQIPPREERVALTLGASRATAFWRVLLPRARPGILAAATTSWARSLGEFGPILVFASSTRLRTEVLPTTVYLEMQAGNLRSALAVSLLLIALAAAALLATRLIAAERTPLN